MRLGSVWVVCVEEMEVLAFEEGWVGEREDGKNEMEEDRGLGPVERRKGGKEKKERKKNKKKKKKKEKKKRGASWALGLIRILLCF